MNEVGGKVKARRIRAMRREKGVVKGGRGECDGE